jgi:hypothetical protein
MLVRKENSLSIAESDVAFPLRTNQRCCVKQILMLAVNAALNTVAKRIETAETWDRVR